MTDTLRIACTGGTGLVGEAIVAAHRKRGDEVTVLRRSGGPPRWDLTGGVTPADAFSGLDAVIHLAGESVASGRWTAARKRAIHDSRVEGTARIVEAIERATPRPSTLICASATGYYGNTGAVTVDEDAPAADDFLGRTCVAWEDAARRAEDLGVRVVHLRFGVVLSPAGGALARMRPFFAAGLGGRVGPGTQPFPWVHLDDVVGAHLWAMDGDVRGPVNVVARADDDNAAFTRDYGQALRRPAVLPVPVLGLRVVFGEMAQVLAGGARVRPRVLLEGGYGFAHPEVRPALEDLEARRRA